ncbi:hypothetical protein FKM82_012875 [Ascaphus truei]
MYSGPLGQKMHCAKMLKPMMDSSTVGCYSPILSALWTYTVNHQISGRTETLLGLLQKKGMRDSRYCTLVPNPCLTLACTWRGALKQQSTLF